MIDMTSEIVANYVSNNEVSIAELPELIRTVSQALNNLGREEPAAAPQVEKPTSAQVKKSVRPEGLVSFIDGKVYKTLKRHLTTNGLSIAEYKERYGLPKDYPTTSPDYSAKRSEMARSLGLGQKRAVAATQKGKAQRKTAAKTPEA